jgi:hypothetical protein
MTGFEPATQRWHEVPLSYITRLQDAIPGKKATAVVLVSPGVTPAALPIRLPCCPSRERGTSGIRTRNLCVEVTVVYITGKNTSGKKAMTG